MPRTDEVHKLEPFFISLGMKKNIQRCKMLRCSKMIENAKIRSLEMKTLIRPKNSLKKSLLLYKMSGP